ncbi:AraC family transcriptional regulator [Jeongeupia sp. HS-3]|uniref:GlxA family transcriptional regulator n=1 Tax=Jeongeupia sp. HS-3 TaxID=1009682 RepID=UPI0018A62D1E|nr:helix-turn-helix domain-containing protein [Jeongeupia sp. HS-3]BCL74701.1 AraC family transcriptional regulator [Jeongeupia sp. HS-3]
MPHSPLRIGLLVYPGCMPAGLLAFADLMHAASLLGGKLTTCLVGLDAGPVRCAHGLVLDAELRLADAEIDALLLPGFWATSLEQIDATLAQHRGLIDALVARPASLQLWSYCDGIAFVAAAGRLNGKPATGTWWMLPWFEQHYPKVNWQLESPLVSDDTRITASGVHGYLAIAEHVVAHSLGADAYATLARLMVLPQPERRHPVFTRVDLLSQRDALLQKLRHWVRRLPAHALSVAALAERLAMSERTLARKVAAATGDTAANFIRAVKLHQLAERLAASQKPASSISDDLGFSSDAVMRRMFRQLTGLTPNAYRQHYGHPSSKVERTLAGSAMPPALRTPRGFVTGNSGHGSGSA